MDIREILKVLPHRYPFLLVDRVLEADERRFKALKNVTFNEPHFQGHFPGHPVMPGVLILEAMAQAARAEGGAYELVPDREEAILKAILEARPGDTVLLAGKGHEATLERGQVALPWNEREAALKALRARGLP